MLWIVFRFILFFLVVLKLEMMIWVVVLYVCQWALVMAKLAVFGGKVACKTPFKQYYNTKRPFRSSYTRFLGNPSIYYNQIINTMRIYGRFFEVAQDATKITSLLASCCWQADSNFHTVINQEHSC